MKPETREALTKCLQEGHLTVDQYLELTVDQANDPISTLLISFNPLEKLNKIKEVLDAVNKA